MCKNHSPKYFKRQLTQLHICNMKTPTSLICHVINLQTFDIEHMGHVVNLQTFDIEHMGHDQFNTSYDSDLTIIIDVLRNLMKLQKSCNF